MLATIYASRLLQLHLIPFTLPISLNSLDREGVRLLSPRDSQILPKPACRCRWYRAGDATELKEEPDEDRVRYVVPFQLISSGAQSGRSGICVAFGEVFFYFGSVVGPWVYLDDVMLYSCIMWSGDCKPTMYLFPYSVHGMCKDYPSCDIAFNVVMPLSRALTCGRYSRIEGVTSWYQSLPRP